MGTPRFRGMPAEEKRMVCARVKVSVAKQLGLMAMKLDISQNQAIEQAIADWLAKKNYDASMFP